MTGDMAERAYEKAIQSDARSMVALKRIDDHEKVCGERYIGIDKKLDMILGRMWSTAIGIIGLLLTSLGFVLAKLLGWW